MSCSLPAQCEVNVPADVRSDDASKKTETLTLRDSLSRSKLHAKQIPTLYGRLPNSVQRLCGKGTRSKVRESHVLCHLVGSSTAYRQLFRRGSCHVDCCP